jgi:hypothetical protein
MPRFSLLWLALSLIVVAGCAAVPVPTASPRPSGPPSIPVSSPSPTPVTSASASPQPSPSPIPTVSPSPAVPSPAGAVIVTFRVADREEFKALVTDPANVAIVRDLLAGKEAPGIPNGRIVYQTGVNTGYHWSMDPTDIEFADTTTEVCDGLPSDVEKRAITSDRYCPWSAKVIAIESAPFSADASPTTATGSPAASPTAVAIPTETALGLPVRTVGEAIGIIASGGANGRAIAVGGFWADPGPISCPPSSEPSTGIEDFCNLRALMETDQHLGTSNGNSSSWVRPMPPFIRPETPETTGLDAIWGDGQGSNGFLRPNTRVVVIGHSDDPRLFGCVGASSSPCATAFVVDRIVAINGEPVDPASSSSQLKTAMTLDAAEVAANAAFPGDSHLLTIVPLPASQAPAMDPRLDVGVDGIVWVARAVVGVPDDRGTAGVEEVVIDDATGLAVRDLRLAFSSDYRPGAVVVQTRVPNGRQPYQSFVGVLVSGGTRVLWGEPGLLVLDQGDHVLRAWRASVTDQQPGEPPESGTPREACTLELHVGALQRLSYTATWTGTGPCSWRATPTP